MKTFDESVEILRDARNRLISFIGAACECDNTHEANKTQCCLCNCNEALERLEEMKHEIQEDAWSDGGHDPLSI